MLYSGQKRFVLSQIDIQEMESCSFCSCLGDVMRRYKKVVEHGNWGYRGQ